MIIKHWANKPQELDVVKFINVHYQQNMLNYEEKSDF